jgi:hypothetical protein
MAASATGQTCHNFNISSTKNISPYENQNQTIRNDLTFKSCNDPSAASTKLADQDLLKDKTGDLQLKATESRVTIPPGHLLPLSLTLSKLQCACHAPIDTKHIYTSKITKIHF